MTRPEFNLKRWVGLAGIMLAIALVPTSLYSLFARPDLQMTPVARLIENIEKQVADDPKNAALLINLARVHGMAYAKKSDELEVEKRKPNEAWFGYISPKVPFGEIVPLDNEFKKEHKLDAKAFERLKATATEHLVKSIETYRRALELDKENATADLGLAWALDVSGKEDEAIAIYRKLIASGWEKEKDMTHGGLTFRSIVAESAGYLLEKLDEEKDKDEIANLNAKVETVSKIMRPVTPIAIPLGDPNWSNVYDASANVRFDADGSGYQRQWTWIRPQAGWLVYDHQRNGKITSALQLFGNVSFWCFWENGYDALRALDDNGDGSIRGDELRGLAIWQDINQNGISELGEVRPLVAHEIEAIDCSCIQSSFDGQMTSYNPRGIERRDGSFGPTYDVILHRVETPETNRLESISVDAE